LPSYAEDIDLCLEVARLVYERGVSQTEVAHRLRISRPTVASLLARARALGIVQISIQDPRDSSSRLERELEEKFGLLKAAVAPGRFLGEEASLQLVGLKASDLLDTLLEYGMTVGLGWGRTVEQLVQSLKGGRALNLTVVPMLGGSGQIAPRYQANELVRRFAAAFAGQPIFLHAPVVVDTTGLRRRLLADSSIRTVMERLERLDMAITGVGTASPSVMDVMGLSKAWQEIVPELQRAQVVGQICARSFDSRGSVVSTGLDRLLITVAMEQIRAARYRIGLAAGQDKVAAIAAALHGDILNVLVTDEPTAARLMG